MGITFTPFKPNACCLCGSSENLTGEHKIKASALRSEFGSEHMVIGQFANPKERGKLAQSVKSKALHFKARMCSFCNNTRTQASDREFDMFHEAARARLANGEDPKLAFDDERYAIGSDAYLNVFRYFAKLLCCHLAELGAPRPRHMSYFALGQTSTNCIWLDVDEDWVYKQASTVLGPHQYAAHGGLVLYGDKKTGDADAFHSTLTLGPLRYVFFSRLNWFERLELRLVHREFHDWCREQVHRSISQPLPETAWLRLGLSRQKPLEK